MKKALRNTLFGLATTATLATAFLAPAYSRLENQIRDDIQSELHRVSSPGKSTTGLKGFAWQGYEHLKTMRDLMLFAVNDAVDDREEYHLVVDKEQFKMQVYTADSLVRTIPIGSGQVRADEKEQFGQYVTPAGRYKVIHRFDQEDLEDKFGKSADLYGRGMLQLSGPWSPYIAIHGTHDASKIGSDKSNGCINVSNDDIQWLYDTIGTGSTVTVLPLNSQ